MSSGPDGDPGAPDVSVVVPVFDHAAHLPRALGSLLAQRGPSWELVVVDDGSPDDPAAVVRTVLPDAPVTTLRHPDNRGLGAACNTGLAAARGRYVAYLPADDVWFDGHLADLTATLDADPAAAGAVTGVRVDEVEHAGAPPGLSLRMVQVAHRRAAVTWTERDELESDDLDRTVWDRLRAAGPLRPTGRVSCEWSHYPGQRSALFRAADDGGPSRFRARYGVRGPLRFAASDADLVDERDLYGDPPPPGTTGRAGSAARAGRPLHVLLVGELAYNPDRVLDLAARGVRLSGLWLTDPLGFMTVGPLPFGGVTDVPRTDWVGHLRRDPPDVAYCLLNWRTPALALQVADALPDLPLVWHFKEAPQRSLARGEWPLLARLWERADRVLLCSDEEAAWLLDALPGRRPEATVGAMDGDLPRGVWFGAPDAPDGPDAPGAGELSAGPAAGPRPAAGGPVHTVCPGRPVGLSADTVGRLAAADVHLHLHGLPPDARTRWLPAVQQAAPSHVHVHPPVPPPRWRTDLARYDAGWSHARPHTNGGDLRRATWDDLNLPARLPTLAAAGLPVVLPAADGAVSAVNRVMDGLGAGLPYRDVDDLVDRLRHETSTRTARQAMAAHRRRLSFDHEVDRLVGVLQDAAEGGGR